MKSRIPKNKDDAAMHFDYNADDSVETSTCTARSTDTEIPNKDIENVMKILHRHGSMSDDDLFGRSFFGMDIMESIQKHKWPALKNNVMSANASVLDQYKKLADTMLDAYVKMLIKRNVMSSPTILKELPVIDFKRNFKRTTDHRADTVIVPAIEFTDDEINTLRPKKGQLFNMRFKEFLLRWNTNLYEYFKIDTVSKNEYVVTYETYIGRETLWILNNRMVVRFILEPNPNGTMSSRISVEDALSYEEILSKYIPDMKWTTQERQFWCDLFVVAPDWNKISLAVMKADEKADYEEIVILFNTKEERAMKKLYADSIYVVSNTADAEKKIGIHSSPRIITRIITGLATIHLTINKNDLTKTETTSDGRLRQTFGKTVIISNEPYFPE